MHCLYINLDSAADRRSALEANFAATRTAGWSLERIAATDTAYVTRANVLGPIRPAEKACFLSHRNAVFHSLGHDGPVLIMEDDTVLSPKTGPVLDALMAAPPSPTWDILYTDIGVADVATMIELAVLRHQLDAGRSVKTLNLAAVAYFGATAYIINPASKAKVLALLSAASVFDVAYDLYLRQLVVQGKLEAHAVFPFATTSGAFGDTSSVQPGGDRSTDLILSLFRKLTWIDGGAAAHQDDLRSIAAPLSADSLALGTLWAAMVDKSFKVK